MQMLIYADNAATTKLDEEVFEAMKPWLLDNYGNASQPYSFSRKPKEALKRARQAIASCINADPEEIYFTSGGTESDNWALKGTMYTHRDHRGLITSQVEHHAILHSAEASERMGYQVSYLPVNSECVVLPSYLRESISDKTNLVSIMLSNNEVGTIQPIRDLADIAHAHGDIFHTDAVQAVGHIMVDVKKLGVDMLSASAHKFNGPKGIGFLYVKKGTDIRPYIDGGAQEYGMRAGTENIASIVGMAVALKNNCDRMEEHQSHIMSLEEELIFGLSHTGLDFVRNGSINHVPGNISLSFRGANGEVLLHRLDLMGICVSTGSACDSKNTQISHVLKAMKLSEEYAKGTIRISLGKDNTLEEVKTIIKGIQKILT